MLFQISQNKRRYRQGGFDLDLTYITGTIASLCKGNIFVDCPMCSAVFHLYGVSCANDEICFCDYLVYEQKKS